jgi:hypothetical protein
MGLSFMRSKDVACNVPLRTIIVSLRENSVPHERSHVAMLLGGLTEIDLYDLAAPRLYRDSGADD